MRVVSSSALTAMLKTRQDGIVTATTRQPGRDEIAESATTEQTAIVEQAVLAKDQLKTLCDTVATKSPQHPIAKFQDPIRLATLMTGFFPEPHAPTEVQAFERVQMAGFFVDASDLIPKLATGRASVWEATADTGELIARAVESSGASVPAPVYIVFEAANIVREIAQPERDIAKIVIQGFKLFTKVADLFGGSVPEHVHLALRVAEAICVFTHEDETD